MTTSSFFDRWSRVIGGVQFSPKKLRWRHKKRGTVYDIIGEAQVQADADAPLTDYEVVVVYQGEDGELWVRRQSEFQAKFEPVLRTEVDGQPAKERKT